MRLTLTLVGTTYYSSGMESTFGPNSRYSMATSDHRSGTNRYLSICVSFVLGQSVATAIEIAVVLGILLSRGSSLLQVTLLQAQQDLQFNPPFLPLQKPTSDRS